MFATGSSTGAITVWKVDPPQQKPAVVRQRTPLKRAHRLAKRRDTRDSVMQSHATAQSVSAVVRSTSASSAELTNPHVQTPPERPTSPWSLLTPSPFHTQRSTARFKVPQGLGDASARLANKSDTGLDVSGLDGRLQVGDSASISSQVRSRFVRKRRDSW